MTALVRKRPGDDVRSIWLGSVCIAVGTTALTEALALRMAQALNEPSPEPAVVEDREPSTNLLNWAWTIIANAGGGNWEKETADWQEAAAKWRDEYHETLGDPDT